jgi:hypothetical protein
MSFSFIIFLVLQACSLLLTGVFYLEYRKIQLQRAEMFHQLEHSAAPLVRGTRIGMAYLLGTVVILLISLVFFFSLSLNA